MMCHSEWRKTLVKPLSTRSAQIKQQKNEFFFGFAFKSFPRVLFLSKLAVCPTRSYASLRNPPAYNLHLKKQQMRNIFP